MNTQTRKAAETAQAATEQFTAVIGDVNERTKTAFEKSQRIAEELAELTRGNVEAIVASSKIAAKGVETMSQDAAEYRPQELRGRLGGLQELRGHQVGDRLLQASGRFRPQRVRQRGRRERPPERDRAEAGRRRRRADQQPLRRGGRACEDPRRVTRESPNL